MTTNEFAQKVIDNMRKLSSDCYKDAQRAWDQGCDKQARDLISIGKKNEADLELAIAQCKEQGIDIK